MNRYYQQACVALKVYCDRGRLAIDLCRQGRFDRLDKVLQKRRASFHNFRAADCLARQAGWNLAEDDDMQATILEAADVDERLKELLGSLKGQMKDELSSISRAKSGISKYRSSSQYQSVFTRGI